MLRIRLRRVGKKKQPSYRIVVAESTAPRDGTFVENIGFYNPCTEPETVKIKEARALHWLSVGAQPSKAVTRIFKTHGTWARFERLKAGESVEKLVAEAQAEVKEAEEETETAPEAEVRETTEVEETTEAQDAEAKAVEPAAATETESVVSTDPAADEEA
ncbi:MAG: 30S ribosomal protein S16 [Anaerolineae bacterium]